MRSVLFFLSVFFLFSACSKEAQHHHENFYTCSMHPQIQVDEPGKCPICGMNLTMVSNSDEEIMSHEEFYYCESDSSVISEAPGECPLDGTPMLKKEAQPSLAQVRIREQELEHFKASLFEVKESKLHKEIRLLGRLFRPENKESNIPARVEGRVEEVFVNSTGQLIKEGQAILSYYSPRLHSSADEYLIARKSFENQKNNVELKKLLQQSTERLKLWGIKQVQLDEWAKNHKVPREIIIHSPVTGIVANKNAVKGKYFKEGESFFDLIDLDSLWPEMDVYEHDLSLVELGQEVDIEFSAYPGIIWKGKIDFISPILDEKSRTLKIRTTLKNDAGKLRPGMIAVATLKVTPRKVAMAIPREAIIDTGKRKVVWIDRGEHRYQAIEVKTGLETQAYVEITHGLSLGDMVVVDGNFLLDSQARLFNAYKEESK